jgi:hypothetical protein
MFWLIAIAVVYALVGFAWGSLLNALTTPNGSVSWHAIKHGVFWPISMLSLLR